MTDKTPDVDSFIVRLIHPGESERRQGMRGTITHIQSSESLHFTDWDEMVRFFRRYLPDEEPGPVETPPGGDQAAGPDRWSSLRNPLE